MHRMCDAGHRNDRGLPCRSGRSRADAVPQSYLRYLVNSLREFFELPGTPVRISLREKANPFAHKRKRPS